MTGLERLERAAIRAETLQVRALATLTHWRKEATARAAFGRPWPLVLAARGHRQAAATHWARAREAARTARSRYNKARSSRS